MQTYNKNKSYYAKLKQKILKETNRLLRRVAWSIKI